MKIIKIGAIWCPGCLVMNKVWNKILDKYDDLNIISLDYDMDNEEVSKYNVGKILPVIIFINKEDNELERLVGEQKEDKIIELIERYKEL